MLTLVVMVACGPPMQLTEPDTETTRVDLPGGTVSVVAIEKDGVKCMVVGGYNGVGISCDWR